MEEAKILKLLWERSEAAIDALAKVFGKRLYRTAMNILSVPEDAEETVNDTYLAIWEAIPPAKPDPLSAYVFRTGRNIALKRLRSQSAQKRSCPYQLCLEELGQILPDTAAEAAVDARALGRAIDSFLQTLDKDSRVLFVRRYWYGDSLRLLAQHTGASENALSVRLHRLRKRLQLHLIKEGFWDEA